MRYIIQESETPGWWVATDTENLVVIRFQEHKFNDTQEVTLLEESKVNPMAIARIMREMGDWLVAHYSEKVF